MKKNRNFLIIFFLVASCYTIDALTYTWSPTSGTLASNGANWLPAGTPATSDRVVFDNTSTTNCRWNIGTINSFSVLSGYTGSIDFGNSTVNIDGSLVINSGTVISTSGDLIFAGSGSNAFILGSSGTFNANNGNVLLLVSSGETFNFVGSIVLKSLTLQGAGGNNPRTIHFGSNLTVNDLILAMQNKVHSYQGIVHVKNMLDIGGNSLSAEYTAVPPNNTATFILDGTSALIVGVNNPNKAPMSNFEINTTGTYTIIDNVNVYGNWTGTQGTLVPGNSVVNFYGNPSAISGTAAAFHDIDIINGSVVNMPANAEVKVSGQLARSGTLNFQTTTALGFNAPGNIAQTISGPAFTLAAVTAYSNGTSRSVAFTGPVTILDSLNVGSQVTFNSNGHVTLGSSGALTARLCRLGTAASVTGSVTVETVIPGGTTGWAQLGVRGVNGQTVARWDTYANSGGTNGIPMTCVGCMYGPTATAGWFKSIQGWKETSSYGYDTTIVAGTTLTPGVGFWLYVGNGQFTTTDLKLLNNGTLKTGPYSVPVTAGGFQSGFNLVANPYPSPISWTAVMANSNNQTTVNDAIYAYSADNGQTEYVNGVGNPGAPGGIDNIIAGGQGFYVLATTGGNLNFTESMKTDGNNASHPIVRSATTGTAGKIFRLKLEGTHSKSTATFRIHDDATDKFDAKFDAKKIFHSPGYVGYPGPYNKYTTISSKDAAGVDYAIQSLPPLSEDASIPVLVRVSTSGTYTITARDFQDFSMCVILIDKLNNSRHDLRSGPYVFSISDTTSVPRFELLLCKEEVVNVHSETAELNSVFITRDVRGVIVKTAFEKNTSAVISAYNILGQKLMADIRIEGTVTNTTLPVDLQGQILIISVNTDKTTITKKTVLH